MRKTVMAAMLGAFLLGCGTSKVALNRSDRVPAAEGQVKVNAEKGGNREVEVKVAHLAPPDRLNGESYVVWIRPLEAPGTPQNVGVLALDNDLEGTLKTSTSFEKFELFVTVEPTRETTNPTGPRVLWSTVD